MEDKKKFKLGKKGKIVIVIVVLALVGGLAWNKFKPNNGDAEMEMYQTLVPLERADIMQEVQTSGKIESQNSNIISAKTDGKIVLVNVKLGDKVTKGQVLAKIDTTSIENEIRDNMKNHDIEVETAKNEVEIQKEAYENSKFSYEIGEISKQDLNKAKDAYIASKSNYEKKKTSIDISKLQNQLRDATIKSPITGTVTLSNAIEGNTSSGVMFVVERIDQFKMTVKISEYDANRVKVGQRIIVKPEMDDAIQLKGRVASVSPTALKDAAGVVAGEGKVQFGVQLKIDEFNPKVKIGSNARATIQLGGKKGVLAVGYDSIIDNGDGTGTIFTTTGKGDKKVAKAIQVKTGVRNDFMIEISGKGLKEGMDIVNGSISLTDGQELKLEPTMNEKTE